MREEHFDSADEFREAARQFLMQIKRRQREYEERARRGEATTDELLELSERVREALSLRPLLVAVAEPPHGGR